MNGRAVKWAVAILVSVALHAGAAIWLAPGEEAIEVAGGAQAEIAMLGNAFQDALSAGSVSEAIQPSETQTDATKPVEPKKAVEPVTEAAQPVTPDARNEPVEQVSKPPVAPSQAIEAEPTQPKEPAEQAEAAAPRETIDPAEPAEEGVAIAALAPSAAEPEQQNAQAPSADAAVQPVEEPDLPPMPDAAPRPTPRPEQVAEAKKPEPKRQAKQETKRPAPKQKQQAGAGGANKQNARRGSADGQRQARQTNAGNSGRSREAGNAAVSNYPGKVYSKLRRNLRYPSQARRKNIRGEVHVSFTVSRAGGVGSVRIARSSGSSVLDNAAVETVRRAAPFPEIPAAAGRSSWSFTVPLAFTR